MSYDLYFMVPEGRDPISETDFVDYFTGRPNYPEPDTQCFYDNKSTGVYFCFQHDSESDEGPEEVAGLRPAGVSFNLNYFRPHVFGLEAEPEVTAFVRHFDLKVFDPQTSGMGAGDYSPEGFLRGWNAGNQFGYRACVDGGGDGPAPDNNGLFRAPAAEIERCWRWNLGVRRLQEGRFTDGDVFVPRILFLTRGREARSLCVWPDAIPILLPRVDYLLIGREKLAPRRLFRKARPDHILVPFADISSVLGLASVEDFSGPCHLFNHQAPPEQLVRFVQNLKASTEKPQLLHLESVLDAELLEEALSARSGG